MKMKALGVAVVVMLGIFFGLMFNAVDQNVALTMKLVGQQGEIADLLRLMVSEDRNAQTAVRDIEKKVDNLIVAVNSRPVLMPSPSPSPLPAPAQVNPSDAEDMEKVYDIPISHSPVKGPADAPVMIVTFLDVQCPFSKRFQPVIDQVLEAYQGKVSYAVKNFPLGFHAEAVPAAKAMLAAGEQGKYWEMMAEVLKYNNQLSGAKYDEIAGNIGLNMKKFKKDLRDNDAAWDALIEEDLKLGEAVDVKGTPTYYVNGRKTAARTVKGFKEEIDAILAPAK